MLKNVGLALVALSLLAIPAAARNGQKGNNGANEPRGKKRAEEVQTANNKGDKDHTPFKGSKSKGEKTRTRKGWKKTDPAEHNATGHKK